MSEYNKSILVWSLAASQDMIRLRGFIEAHNKDAARRAAEAIKKAACMIREYPAIGKIIEGREEREIFIPFGQRGYEMRYRVQNNTVVILRIWHGLEKR